MIKSTTHLLLFSKITIQMCMKMIINVNNVICSMHVFACDERIFKYKCTEY